MSNLSILEKEKFWQTIKYLLELSGEKSFNQICSELEISNIELNSYLNFLTELNYLFEVENLDQKVLKAPEEKPKVNINLSLFEWLEFQAHFPKLSENSDRPYFEGTSKKLEEIENEYENFSLFQPAMTLEQVLDSQQGLKALDGEPQSHNILISLEESILEKEVISIKLHKGHKQVFPRKIVYFDGELNLIAEDLGDSSLININLSAMEDVFKEELSYKETYTRFEIDDFVSSIREMGETFIRLVLKIYSKDNFSLKFDHMYFEKPCFFSNPDGDFIWAATVEPSEELFEWLNELGPSVEILDPSSVKIEFLNYCEDKLKKLA